MSLLQLDNVSKHFGSTPILRNVNLSHRARGTPRHHRPERRGQVHAVSPDQRTPPGERRPHPVQGRGHPLAAAPRDRPQGLARSFQVSSLFPQLSVFENLRCALLWPLGYGYSFWHLLHREKALNARTEGLLEELGLWQRRHLPAGELAYAEQRALELGLAIASGAELILLDEPVAGMSVSEARQALALIRRVTAGKTLVMVEHDMAIVFDMAQRISVLVHGELIASDTPENIRRNPRVQEAYLGVPVARGRTPCLRCAICRPGTARAISCGASR
jgi:branched-chain amino acid transport system ATP-binding protein